MTAPRDPIEAPQDAIRELIRVSKSAGMNAASDFGYLPSQQQADEQEISEAVQSVYAAIEAAARDEGRQEAVRLIESEPFFPNADGPTHGNAAAFRDYKRRIIALVARHGRSSDPTEKEPNPDPGGDDAWWEDCIFCGPDHPTGLRLAPQERRDKEGTADTRTTENPDPLLRLPCNCDNDGWYVHDPDCLRGIAWEARAEARESAVSAVVKGMTDLRREAEAAQGTAPRAEEMTAVELTPDNTIIVNGTTLPAWVAATIARRAAPRAEGLEREAAAATPSLQREVIESWSRLQDAYDALRAAILWLHGEYRDTDRSEFNAQAWYRKARSGSVGLRDFLARSEREAASVAPQERRD